MTKTNTNLLCERVESALNQLNLDELEKTSATDWKYTIQGISAQTVVADVLQNDAPYLLFYFKVVELEEKQKSLVLEELMKANMQLTMKYGLMENRVIQAAEFAQTSHLSVENILSTISVYSQHVLTTRKDIQRLIDENGLG